MLAARWLLWRRQAVLTALLRLGWVLACSGAGAQTPALMPLPAHMEQRAGEMIVDGSFDVVLAGFSEPRLDHARERFLGRVTLLTGVPLRSFATGAHTRLRVHVAGPSKAIPELGEDESYRLEVAPGEATLTAATSLGALHGLQTFLQLIRPTPQGFGVAAVSIDDRPRFPWRGLMLDTSRHFMPLAEVWQTLDGLEAVKMNVFHWHLSDDQGFRVESKIFPRLQGQGSDGLFYTQDEVRATVRYASERGIRVIPEFDMPGHTTAWFAGYPELASAPGPYSVERRWGVFDPAMDPTREETYAFLDKLLGEMTALFPDAFFHIGGDECNGKQWDANPRIQAFMRAQGLKDNAALQALFTARVQRLVAAHGKQTVGWDEVLEPGTPHNVVIQSWRGPASLAAAARQGYRGLLSSGFYVDLNQPAGEHYLVEPLDASASGTGSDDASSKAAPAPPLTPEQERNILGGEATMWTEFISPEILHNRVWPRTAVIAERLWSPRGVRDVSSMYARLPLVSHELDELALPNGRVRTEMLVRLSGRAQPTALEVLASVLQPPRDYTREELRPYTQLSPLNHLVDALPAESDRAREFTVMAGRIQVGTATAAERTEVRRSLELWAGNDAVLAPQLGASDMTAELAKVSHDLSHAAAIGLAALARQDTRSQLSTESAKEQVEALKAMETLDRAALRNMIVPGVLLLLEGR